MSKKTKNILRKILMLLCILVIIICVYKIAYDFYSASNAYSSTKELSSEVVQNSENYTTVNDINVNFDNLKKKNPDSAAWLMIPNTEISYPVVHRANDNDFYLYHTFDGSSSTYGTIFLDGQNNNNFEDPVSFVFGHNISTFYNFGKKIFFASLVDFEDKDYLNEHNKAFLYTENNKFEYKIIGVINEDQATPLYKTDFANDAEYEKYLRTIEQKLGLQSNTLNTKNKLLAMVTCTISSRSATQRRILFAYR